MPMSFRYGVAGPDYFAGSRLGGYLLERLGSYDLIWYVSIALGIVADLLNLPIDEREIKRPASARSAT